MRPAAKAASGDADGLKCELAKEVLRSSGRLRLQVTGWSMLPTLWPGDTLMIERAGWHGIAPGDVVLFGRDGRLFVHRVISKSDRLADSPGLITQGDGMPAPDPPVSSSELLGKINLICRGSRSFRPSSRLHFPNRIVAAIVRNSVLASRILVSLRGRREISEEQALSCHN